MIASGAPSEMVELILLRTSQTMSNYLWLNNNEAAVSNTYRILASVCHDWWSLLRRKWFQQSLRTAFLSSGR